MQVEPEGGPTYRTVSAGVVVIMEGIAGGLVLIQGRRFRGNSLPRKRRALAYARQRPLALCCKL